MGTGKNSPRRRNLSQSCFSSSLCVSLVLILCDERSVGTKAGKKGSLSPDANFPPLAAKDGKGMLQMPSKDRG